jgi:hypothetical protein
LQELRDVNIVQFLGACLTVERPLLVTEYMMGGNLYNAIQKDRNGVLLWYRRYVVVKEHKIFLRRRMLGRVETCKDIRCFECV